MTTKYPFVCLIIIIFIQGCSYPCYRLEELDELTFTNKRLDNRIQSIHEFIIPLQTKNTLDNLCIENLSSDTSKNLIINILNYVQQVKLVTDKEEFWQYPKETIEKGGDCEDKTFLLLSMLIQAGIEDVKGVKGRYLGGGHMWVEYNGFILDPLQRKAKLIPIKKSLGYVPYFKFDKKSSYYCDTGGRHSG